MLEFFLAMHRDAAQGRPSNENEDVDMYAGPSMYGLDGTHHVGAFPFYSPYKPGHNWFKWDPLRPRHEKVWRRDEPGPRPMAHMFESMFDKPLSAADLHKV